MACPAGALNIQQDKMFDTLHQVFRGEFKNTRVLIMDEDDTHYDVLAPNKNPAAALIPEIGRSIQARRYRILKSEIRVLPITLTLSPNTFSLQMKYQNFGFNSGGGLVHNRYAPDPEDNIKLAKS